MTFIDKMRAGETVLGTVITFNDPTVTEALCNVFDFVWIDMEHNAFTLETMQAHLLATKGSNTTPIVRVPVNDPVIIKTVLDVGAAGVIVPMVRDAEDVRRAVAACRYPPDGIRGFGPRRPGNYGLSDAPTYIKAANAAVIVVAQIEQIDAINNIDDILAVPGLTAITTGANDLAGSMGLPGQPRHPVVLQALETVLSKCKDAGVFAGVSVGDDPTVLVEWANKGAQWLAIGADFTLLLRAARQVSAEVREWLGGAK